MTLDARAETLLAPVRDQLAAALLRLGDDPPDLTVAVAPTEGTHTLHGDRLTLSEGLLGPAVHHPDEPLQPLPPLDRWRRAVGAVLEAMALRRVSRRLGQPPGRDWCWQGLAVHLADRAAPALGLAAPDLARAVVAADCGVHPRSGVAVLRAWEALGDDPGDRALDVLRGVPVSTAEWVRLGLHVLDRERGPAAVLPVLVERPAPVDIPCTLGPWAWCRLHVPAHRRGGFVAVDGPGAVAEPWAVAAVPLETIAGATHGPARLAPESGGPVGTWSVASAQGFGQVLGARGVVFRFKASGRLEIVLADAFVGPLAAVDVGDRVGTSGLVPARWTVAGPHRLRMHDVRTDAVTMHDRAADRFAVPARGFGMGDWLRALADAPWGWQRTSDRLVLQGRMLGSAIEVRLKPE